MESTKDVLFSVSVGLLTTVPLIRRVWTDPKVWKSYMKTKKMVSIAPVEWVYFVVWVFMWMGMVLVTISFLNVVGDDNNNLYIASFTLWFVIWVLLWIWPVQFFKYGLWGSSLVTLFIIWGCTVAYYVIYIIVSMDEQKTILWVSVAFLTLFVLWITFALVLNWKFWKRNVRGKEKTDSVIRGIQPHWEISSGDFK